MANTDLTAQRLRELLHYDPETGDFTWLVKARSMFPSGSKAGTRVGRYIKIGINQKRHSAHRLAWLYVHGQWPDGVIDHINGDGLDNSIANLRDVSFRLNGHNRKTPPKAISGHRGVRQQAWNNRWTAYCVKYGKFHTLGTFDTLEEAVSTRAAYEADLFGNGV